MAWERKQNGSSFITGSTIYAFQEVDWNVGETECTYTHRGGVTSPYGGWNTTPSGTLYWREWNGSSWGSWVQYETGSEHYSGPGDLVVVSKDDSFVRAAADREIQLDIDVSATSSTGSGSDYVIMGYTVPHTAGQITSLTATRVNDNQVNLSWTKPATAIDGVQLQVSIDGSAWSSVTTLGDSSSCQYKYASSDHSYRFRVRATYQGSKGAWSNESAEVVMKPAPISSLTTKAAGGTSVDVVLVNPSPVAEKVQYQVSQDDGATWGAVQDAASLTGFTVTITGTGKVKAWNVNATGQSAPIYSGTIVTICPPDKPSPVSPQDGATVQAGDVTFSWDYVTLDGSDQTAWELDYTTDDWTTTYPYYSDASTAGDTSLTITIPSGFTVKWKVRTKGAATTPNNGWSDWCAVQTCYSYAVPTITFASPSHITGMPIDVVARFTDLNGTCRTATVTVAQGRRSRTFYDPAIDNGATPPTITQRITLDEFAPEDDPSGGNPVTITVYAGSSTGLSNTANVTLSPHFTEPTAGDLSVVNEPDTGYVSLIATFDNDASDTEYSGDTNTQYDSEPAYVKSLTVEGQSAKWNQLVHDGNFPSGTGYWTSHNNCSSSIASNTNTCTATAAASATNCKFLVQNIALSGSHVYYVGVDVKAASSGIRAYFIANSGSNRYSYLATTTGAWTHTSATKVFPDTSQTFKQIQVVNDTAVSVGDVYEFRNLVIVDLTAIYGSGNEPSAADFEASALYRTKYAPNATAYDAGSLVSIGGSVERWNQLFDNAAPSETVNGTTFTDNGDGTWNVTGAYSSTPFKYVTDAPMQPSHKLLVMQGTTPSNAYVRVGFDSYVGAAWRDTKIASGTMEILATYSACDNIKPFIVVDPGWIATDDIKLTPRIIDLTAIFGAGNEPTSTSDARVTALATYAATHYDYEANGVMEGSEGGVGVMGRNIATLNGIARAASGLTWTANGSEVSVANTSSADWAATNPVYIPVPSATEYTITLSAKPSDLFNGFYASFKHVDENKADLAETLFCTWVGNNDVASKTFYTHAGTAYLKIAFGARYSGTVTNKAFTVMIEKGGTAHAYEPYRLTTIPALLRSAGTVHDQLQVAKTDVKVARKVGYVDLGSLTWTYQSANSRFVSTSQISGAKPAPSGVTAANMLCARFVSVGPDGTSGDYSGEKIAFGTGDTLVRAMTNTTTDPAAFKTAMNGVYLFYELATPTEEQMTDIEVMEIGTAFTVDTDLDSTFAMTTWDGAAEAVSISVSRVNEDGISTTPLITDGENGAGAVDKYAPLNKVYQYAVTTKSSADAVKTVYVDNIIESDKWFAYWTVKEGENVVERMASAKWNPDNGGIQIARPQKIRVFYAGRKDPVSYDGAAVSLTETPSWMLVEDEEAQPFVQLIEDGGRGVYKSCDGWVYHADFDLMLTPKYIAIGYYGGIGLTVTRIAGDLL